MASNASDLLVEGLIGWGVERGAGTDFAQVAGKAKT